MEFKLPKRQEISNKGTYGRVLNIAGSDYMPGAAYLSSVAALKMGCGYCFLCSGERVINSVSYKTSNVVFEPLKNLPNLIKYSDVISIGCGLGTDSSAVHTFSTFIDNSFSQIPIVIDADGLNILADNNIDLQYDFNKKKYEKLVLTPHPKEAARLLGCQLEEILMNTEAAAKEISEKYGCITVLKMHKTFVYSPDGRSYTNSTGNNSMAKAGSGDVLTGMIAGLLAQGADIFEGTSLAVYLHGLCGDIAKEKLTEYSVMAEDLISFIPDAIKCIS